jgi:uncharacterized membrane protein YfcA
MGIDAGTFVALFFAAIAIGGVASMLGLGGGVFMTPLLLLGGFVSTQPEAAGTSLAAIVFTALSGSFAYYRRRAIDVRIGLLFTPSALSGVVFGTYVVRIADPAWLTVAFGIFLLYPIAMMLTGRTTKEVRRAGRTLRGVPFYALVALLGFAAGTVTKLFGIGGGTVFVPSLVFFLGLDITTAVATSLFVMIPTAILGAVSGWFQGYLHPELALPLILGIVLGAQVGPILGSRISKRRLRQLFGLVLLYAAVNMILKGLR